MDVIDFVKKAKEVADQYEGYCFEKKAIAAVVGNVTENWIYGEQWDMSSIEFYSGIDYASAGIYHRKLEIVLGKLGIKAERLDVGEETKITNPKFK